MATLNNRNKSIYVGGYIRTSTETQGSKVSPEIQQEDIRKYCEEHNYILIDMYLDISRYRVGKKLVEPSGSRVDRPEFQRMLTDAKLGKINCIVAWREDRLYRGFRPMLEVLEAIEQTPGLTLELVKEHFDMNMAPVKAWVAKMELGAKNDRWLAGMTGRVRNGKPIGREAYGYIYDKENTKQWFINEEEAPWVDAIWKWYGQGYSLTDIHNQLILHNAPQKFRGNEGTKTIWSEGAIRNILKKDYYYTGKLPIKLGGEIVYTDVPQLIDEETYQRAIAQRKKWNEHRTPHRNHEYTTAWLEGLIYCQADGWKLGLNYSYNASRTVEFYEYYRCTYRYHHHELIDGCIETIRMNNIDHYVWSKVWNFISNPEDFETRLLARIEQIQLEQAQVHENITFLQNRLDELQEERRRVQTMYRKGRMKDQEFDEQMAVIEAEESEINVSIAHAGKDYSSEIERIKELAQLYRNELLAGLEGLANEPDQNDREHWRDWSNLIKRILQTLVKRVEVSSINSPIITTHIDLLNPMRLGILDTDEFVISNTYSLLQYSNSNLFESPIPANGTIFAPLYHFEFVL